MVKSCFIILVTVCILIQMIKCESSDESDIDFAEEAKRIIVESCRTPNATDADVEAVINDDNENLSYERKCIEACILKALGILKEEGYICIKTAVAYLQVAGMDEDKIDLKREAIGKCKEMEETDECEIAFKFGQCFNQEMQEFDEDT